MSTGKLGGSNIFCKFFPKKRPNQTQTPRRIKKTVPTGKAVEKKLKNATVTDVRNYCGQINGMACIVRPRRVRQKSSTRESSRTAERQAG